MQDFTVLFADTKSEAELTWARSLLPETGLHLYAPAEGRPEELSDLLPRANAIVTRFQPIAPEMMDAAPQLKLIQRYSTRFDGVDLLAARQRGIRVATMPLHGAVAVAELAIALILALSKNLLRAHRETVRAHYLELGIEPILTDEHTYHFNWVKLPGLAEVYGRTLGIIGFGEIGTEASRRALALGMRVVYNKRQRLSATVEQAEEAAYRTKDELVRESDFLLLSTPLTAETAGMIGRRELAMMKTGAYLVNVAKGGVLDEEALVEALKRGQIAGAGLDVFVKEPLPQGHPLLDCDNVILTPHIGGGTAGAKEKQMRAVLDNVRQFVESGLASHQVA
jgi:phosphoglycerate dehydrogenase-like enzyme